ncbi:MAG: CoxG family protein [Egibacteraceae bacterium]
MKVSGSHTLHAPPQKVWDALQDPEVLVRTIPGCKELSETGQDEYTATVEAGVASIKGTYDGKVQLTDQDEPTSYTLKASGAGGPGTIDATAKVRLAEAEDGETELSYDADAVVGGTIAGVGQRVLSSVAKRNAAQFFEAVDKVLTGEEPLDEAEPEQAAEEGAEETDQGEESASGKASPGGKTYRAPQSASSPAASGDPKLLLAAGVIGALIALIGVIVGRGTR